MISEAPSSLRWSAIIGGAVAALGISVLLYSLGLALGLSAINPENPGSVRGSSIFTGVWALVVSLIALFVGGYVAARGAGALTRMAGGLHGLVMWGLTVVAGMWLIGSVASTVVSSAAVMGREASQMMRERGGDRGPAADRDDARLEGRMREGMAMTRGEALRTAEDTGKAFWGVFGGLFLGMIAAIGGALVGSAHHRRPRKFTAPRERPTTPTMRHREAYP